ncbi:hypothetical protein SMD44_p10226 (plasmid) [Streptomyces alboflavus]|uniref:Uncharacterized protein n=1 Tax=Streptomyces alboflavus TaxID=67267 RepID=A0A291W3M2_9ACTN|nr:hypothetical protein [Streptomyces alboflavus]ATM24725.1 hypothetical protein SMD44_p10226 [Streptomyces alboflavus]
MPDLASPYRPLLTHMPPPLGQQTALGTAEAERRPPYARADLRSASSLADRITTSLESDHRNELRAAGLLGLVPLALGEDAGTSQLPPPRGELHAKVMLGRADMVAAVRQWRRLKVAYDVDSDLSESLADMEVDTNFPGEVLRQLPHPDPLFMLRKPVVIPDADGAPSEVLGFLVVGRPALNGVCSTTDIADELPLYMISVLVRPAHGELGSALLFASAAAGTTTVRKMVDTSVHLTEQAAEGPRMARSATHDYVRRLSALVISHMLYLCSDRPDVRPTTAVGAPRAHGSRNGRRTRIYQMGWRLGPAISAFHRKVERLRESTVSLGGTVVPHIRRGHLHMYLHGPKKAWKKTRWVAPTLVNAALFGDEAHGVVVPVF